MRSVRLSALLATLLPAFVIMVGLLAPGPQRAAAQDAPAAPTPPAGDPPLISFRVYLPQLLRSNGLTASFPPDGASGQSLNTFLAWNLTDPSPSDLRFTVLLEADDNTPDVVIASGLTAPHFALGGLGLDTLYYWQVIVTDANSMSSAGPVWHFRTEPWWNTPPVDAMMPVPAGEFWMGCDAADPGPTFGCSYKDTPMHRVWLDAYAIDKFEVTNSQYVACVRAGACDWPRKSNSHEREEYLTNSEFSLYPVLYVSEQDGAQYCSWVGKRLPTEAEWEKAARGPIDTRPFPWGNAYPDCTRANRPTEQTCPNEPDDTSRVGRYPNGASPYGVHDLSGNVFEWVQDKYDEYYYHSSPLRNPVNLSTSRDFFVIRGGSYRDRIAYMRTFHRHFGHHGDTVGGDSPFYRSDRVGFRCALSLP